MLNNAVTQQLKAKGIAYSPSWLFDKPEFGISNGIRVRMLTSEIIYQMPNSHTVLIVLYRKAKADRLSLLCSFTPLAWFIRFIVENVPTVKVVKGLVDVSPYQTEHGISSRRLLELYKRCGAAEVVIDGRRWVQLEIDRYSPIR
jgi:type III secretion system regulator LcrR